MNPLRVENATGLEELISGATPVCEREVLSEDAFKRMIAIERKRTERSREPFLLMLLAAGERPGAAKVLERVVAALLPAIRDTDVVGWYTDRATVGAVFTGLGGVDKRTALSTILGKVTGALRDELPLEEFSQVSISFHFFPDEWDENESGDRGDPVLYPDRHEHPAGRRSMVRLKRLMDIAGSLFLLALCLPILLVIAAAIKATSKGPVFFRQQRVGQYGRQFSFLKFRSMYVNNDPSVHREYVKQLIAGNAERIATEGNSEGVYKLANDRRITSIGRFLRRTSLDELPQFLNVLWGDMSLVGPRPPIPYELAAYQIWHRRRLLQVKPGITGLWQVTGRSRVTFDDMVRLDLHYATTWSPWLDVKILLRTPGAVIRGAY